MAPWNKDIGPLAKNITEGDLRKKEVDALVKKSSKIKNKKCKNKEIFQLYSNCLDNRRLVQELHHKTEQLTEEEEPNKVKNYDQKKTQLLSRLTTMKTQLEEVIPKILPYRIQAKPKEEEEEQDDKEEVEEEESEDEDEESEDEDEEEEEEEEKEQTHRFVAVNDYDAVEEGDLGFKKGTILTVIEKREDGWWMAENDEGNTGLVPSTFLQTKLEEVMPKILPDMTEEEYLKAKPQEIEEEEDDDEEEEDDEEEVEDEESEDEDEESEDEEEEEEEEKKEQEKKKLAASKSKKDIKENSKKEKKDEMDVTQQSTHRFVAVNDYDAVEEGDLGFKKGTILTVIEKREDGWWMAENDEGNTGLVPSTFLQTQFEEFMSKILPELTEKEYLKAKPQEEEEEEDDDEDEEEVEDEESEDEDEEEADDDEEEVEDEESEDADEEEEEEEEKEQDMKKLIASKSKKDIKEKSKKHKKDTHRFVAVVDYDAEKEGDLGLKKGTILTVIEKREDGWWMAENDDGKTGLVPSTYLQAFKTSKRHRQEILPCAQTATEPIKTATKPRKQKSNFCIAM